MWRWLLWQPWKSASPGLERRLDQVERLKSWAQAEAVLKVISARVPVVESQRHWEGTLGRLRGRYRLCTRCQWQGRSVSLLDQVTKAANLKF